MRKGIAGPLDLPVNEQVSVLSHMAPLTQDLYFTGMALSFMTGRCGDLAIPFHIQSHYLCGFFEGRKHLVRQQYQGRIPNSRSGPWSRGLGSY
jgi:hypothetical protein